MDYQKELDQFEEYLNSRASEGTVRTYRHALRHWFDQLDGIVPSKESAQTYLDKLILLGKSPNTVNLRAHAILRWFKWKGKRIDLDCPTIRLGEPDYLVIEQIEELITFCNTVLERVLVVVLFDTAVRISELLNLELDDIDWAKGFVTVTRKGGRRENVNITEKALLALGDWLDARTSNDKRVFMDIDYNYAWLILRNLGKRAGIPVHPHIFRHSRAIHMLMNGADMNTVKEHLGHKKIATTMDIYGRFMSVHLKKLVPTW